MHLGAEGCQPSLDARAHVREDGGLFQGESLVGVSASGVEDDDLAGDSTAQVLEGLVLAYARGIAVSNGAGEPLEGPVGRESAGAVSLESDIALELPHG